MSMEQDEKVAVTLSNAEWTIVVSALLAFRAQAEGQRAVQEANETEKVCKKIRRVVWGI